MNPETASLVGRVLRRTGGATAALATLALVALRLLGGGVSAGDPLTALGRGVLVASAAMLLTLLAALGLGLLIAGLAFRLDEPRPLDLPRVAPRADDD